MNIKAFGLLFAIVSGAVLAKPVFETYTEEKTTGWSGISKMQAKLIVNADANLKSQADKEMADKDMRAGDYQPLFASRKLPLSSGRKSFLFIRPKSDPYFQTFYGAHTFFHWIMDERNNIVYAGNSDAFHVLSSSHNGMKDIQESQCRGGKCYLVKLSFKAGRYEEFSCSTQEIEGGKITKGCDPEM
ncbi:hypothetical protein [Aquitalea magnusonii]|uniref:hypothetical protein n=1 Tax=Aquitalea magnusonii TaxID=332411 RepID=UPI000B5C1F38|nr:hypothetical protein [Aquitalea magnusonii]